jgi:hypothetical protein
MEQRADSRTREQVAESREQKGTNKVRLGSSTISARNTKTQSSWAESIVCQQQSVTSSTQARDISGADARHDREDVHFNTCVAS